MAAWTTGIPLGPYVLLEPIGAGGMGEVWKARDTRLDRIVAIKRLKAEHSERFNREARAIAALNHPHICQIYDVGSDYLVMEHIEGAPLRCPLPPEEAVRLAVQIASALEEAHSRGITHRDLKPGNILVNAKGAIKLLDFGLAKLESAPPNDSFSTLTVGLTEAGAVVGTVAYMSPEQAQGQAVDARSDIFSFGLVLYEMLSGRRAFAGESAFAIMSAIVKDEPAPMKAPAALTRIILRCLAKQSSARYQTAAEVKADLERTGVKPAEQLPSIAVLPFANMSADKENEYFSDGLAEEIINVLAHIPGLKVIARTSAFAFRGKEQDIRGIAEALGVRTILEGSVRRAGNRIRVTAQLINAEDGSHLWSDRYDRELADVFAIQDEIAQAITGGLQLKLALRPRYTPKLAAYEALLRGRHHRQKLTRAGHLLARECFEQAIALDPAYAAPHAELGLDYLTAATTNVIRPMIEAASSIQTEAQCALELDPSENNPYLLLGSVAAVYDYDRKRAAEHFAKAMGGNSVSADARWAYSSFYLQPQGRFREAREQFQAAVEQDPLNVSYRAIFGHLLLVSGMFSEAMVELRRALEMDETHWLATFNIGEVHMATGKFAEAAEAFESIYRIAPSNSFTWGLLAAAWARAGDKDRAEALVFKHADSPKPVWGRVAYHLWCLELDEAAKWYEKMIEQREPFALIFAYDPTVKPLRESPHWPRLAAMMNLPKQA